MGCSASTGASVRTQRAPACGGVGVAGERAEPQQAVGGERVLRRRRVVLEVLGRTMSASASAPVVKKPPRSSSAKSATRSSATARASVEPRDVVDLGEGEQRLEQRGVVLRVRGDARRGRPATSAAAGRRRGAARRAGSGRSRARRPSSRRGRTRRRPRPARGGTARSSRAAPCRRGRAGPAARARRAARAGRGRTASGTVSVGPTAWRMLPRNPVCGSSKLPRMVTPK